jgi:hypothetical protein
VPLLLHVNPYRTHLIFHRRPAHTPRYTYLSLYTCTETLSTQHTLQRLGEFAGLNESGWDVRVLQDVTNSGGKLGGRGRTLGNGHHNTFKGKPEPPGRYEVSGYRPMLNRTRDLISRREQDMCRTIHREFGVGCRLTVL